MFFELLQSFVVILVLLLLISILVLVHEFGHFLFAKLFRVEVKEFAVGFGTKMFSFTRWGTEFCVRMIPLGGFVDIDQETQDSDYNKLKLYKKILILFGGVLFNLIFALVLSLAYLNFQQGKVIIPNIQEYGFSSEQTLSGSLVRNIIVDPRDRSIGANELKGIDLASTLIISNLNGERSDLILVSRDDLSIFGQKQISNNFEEFPDKLFKVSLIPGTSPTLDFFLDGDLISNINQLVFDSLDELNEFISSNQGKVVQISVFRGDDLVIEDVELPFRSQRGGILNVFLQEVSRTQVIFGPNLYILQYQSDLIGTFSFVYDLVIYQLKAFGGLISQAIEIQNIQPLADSVGSLPAIANQAGQILEFGDFASLVLMMILLNISLAIFNMLPIPALDGGQIFLSCVEASFFGRLFSLRLKKILNLGSFIFLMSLGILVIFKDFVQLGTFNQISTLITRIFGG